MLDPVFLEWLRATTEARWADPTLRSAAGLALGDPAWQPGTRWRGGISRSDLRIVEAMFTLELPAAYRTFLAALHTPDPALAGLQSRGGRLVVVEERRFTDWTGPTPPVLAALERPLEGLLRGVALGRWHPAWGPRPSDERDQARLVRRLAAAAPPLIPFAGHRYLVAMPGEDDGPVLAVRGADAMVVAPDLRSGLLRELGLADPLRQGATEDPDEISAGRVAFWSDVVAGIPWHGRDTADRT